MRAAIPVHDGRISPVFDAARHLLVIDILDGEEVGRNELVMQDPESLRRGRSVAAFGIDVLICGAVSRPLETMLESAGVTVIARKCGNVEEVLQAFMADELSQDTFLMPGCRGQCRRKRGRRHGGRPRING
jgi:predicted Fe-Mo cluster-binding NifX family protein